MPSMPSTEFERDLLGAILVTGGKVLAECGGLRDEDFYHPSHRAVFQAMRALEAKGEAIEPKELLEQMKLLGTRAAINLLGGEQFLAELILACFTPTRTPFYLGKVLEASEARKRVEFSRRMLAEGTEDEADPATFSREFDTEVLALDRVIPGEIETIVAVAKKVVASVDERYQGKTGLVGVSTGIKALDNMTGGLRPGEMFVLAARPSMGKTALACNVALLAAESGASVLFLSLEMSTEAIVERMLAIRGVPYAGIRSPRQLTDNEWTSLTVNVPALKRLDLSFSSKVRDISDIRQCAAGWRLKSIGKPGLVVFDYLQLASADAEGREREVSEISRGLKSIAIKCGLPVLALSQLNRECEKRTDKRPMLSDLRESGSIEQDADAVLFLYRDGVYNAKSNPEDAELLIAKQRNGPTGMIGLRWQANFQRFTENERRV